MYATFEFYANTYGGAIPESEFKPLAAKAASLINYYTFNRITTVTDEIKYAQCELIDNIKEFSQQDKQEKTSQKVGSYSVTYAHDGSNPERRNAHSQRMIINRWLPPELVYRGL